MQFRFTYFLIMQNNLRLWSLGMRCHLVFCTASQKVLVLTGDVVLYILVRSFPEGSFAHWGMFYTLVWSLPESSYGNWGCCTIHFGAQHPRRLFCSLGDVLYIGAKPSRRFLCSLGMWCYTFWCAASQKVLLLTGGCAIHWCEAFQKVLMVTGDAVPYILVRSIPEGSCGQWGCGAIHWCEAFQKVLMLTGDVVLYFLVCSIPEGFCGHWGCGAIHFSAYHPRRFLWSLEMLCHTFWCASSQKFLMVTGEVVLYILVHIIPEGSCGHWGCVFV
jgi:hypothetical protein